MTPFLTVDDAAALLQLHPNTVRSMARGGKLPAKKVGKYWRFSNSMLKSWIEGEFVPLEQGKSAPCLNVTAKSTIYKSTSTADVFARLRALGTK